MILEDKKDLKTVAELYIEYHFTQLKHGNFLDEEDSCYLVFYPVSKKYDIIKKLDIREHNKNIVIVAGGNYSKINKMYQNIIAK